jgi:hypothetical protein
MIRGTQCPLIFESSKNFSSVPKNEMFQIILSISHFSPKTKYLTSSTGLNVDLASTI